MSGFTKRKNYCKRLLQKLLDEKKPMSKDYGEGYRGTMWCKTEILFFINHFKDIPDVVEFILKKESGMRFWKHPQDRASILECMEEWQIWREITEGYV